MSHCTSHKKSTRLIVIAADVVGRLVVLRHNGGLVEEVELGREQVGAAEAEERQEVLRLGPLSHAAPGLLLPRGGRRRRSRGRGGGARVRLLLLLLLLFESGLRLRPAPSAARGHYRPRDFRRSRSRLGRAARRRTLTLGELALSVYAGPEFTKIGFMLYISGVTYGTVLVFL